jgi:hypothetical protein
MDSFATTTKNLRSVSNWLQEAFPQKTWRFVRAFSRAHQKDDFNCGPYVCLYAELVAKGYNVQEVDERSKNISISDYRSKLLNQLEKSALVANTTNDLDFKQQESTEVTSNVTETYNSELGGILLLFESLTLTVSDSERIVAKEQAESKKKRKHKEVAPSPQSNLITITPFNI